MHSLNQNTTHYDLSLLKELDDEECVKEVIVIFLESTPALLEEIGEAIESEDWENIYQKAHKLKSSVGLLKMDILYKYVGDMEISAKEENDLLSIKAWFRAALAEYQIASGLLKREIS